MPALRDVKPLPDGGPAAPSRDRSADGPAALPAPPFRTVRPGEDLGTLGPADARALSKELFVRLGRLEQGTREYSYVRGTLVELNLTLVRFAAARYRGRGEPMEDIVQAGTVGLIKAIDGFDLSAGVEFPTFALPTIRGELKRFFRDTGWMVHVPRRLQELRLALAKAGDELEQRSERTPTVAELAAYLDLSEREVVEGQKAANAHCPRSLDAPDDGDGGGTTADRFAVEEKGFEATVHLESLKPLVAELPERERTVLALRFGAELTQAQIGERLGLSQMQVSRILLRILGRLRAGLLTDD
ncbi:RNA polymerase sigma factor [Kitasatospora indigofera]|uniref:RNA polymerase sigma factor n=1 Tax=Kitasatospora indigofera TaxID=67307 RepID=A0A919FN42_9ACTN|nr:SigB/SigF/SigG family RNA polymerase sigma factor [Kitasatospora indigofera]GHH69246.1 RNA polymerase sigma factor [Kitasatospora indigofera]